MAGGCDVLILGASFAGIELFYKLRKRRAGRALKITVVDRQAAHGYIPLVQERLCERLDMARSELPTARAVAQAGGNYVIGEVEGVDLDANAVVMKSGERISGRFLVIALGSVLTAPPGMAGREHLIGYKFAEELKDAHAQLAGLLGGAEEPASRRLVVIGGGISGVELAGELAHLAQVRPQGWRVPEVTLIQAGERLLPHLSERAGRKAEYHLRRQGVDLGVGTRVGGGGPGSVAGHGGGGRVEFAWGGAYWAGGVRPAPVLERFAVPRTAGGWLAVGPTLQCFPMPAEGRAGVFACGDAVRVLGGTGEWPTMQRAIECIWQAEVVARTIVRRAAEPAGYPRGVPALHPHVLRPDFPHGVSIGGASLVVYGGMVVDNAAINTWFRRFLMRQYFARYTR